MRPTRPSTPDCKIPPAIHNWSATARINTTASAVPSDFTYRSDNNPAWMTIPALRGMD